MANRKDYEVGYKKPPKHTQFVPGVSGNPKGKPKKNKTLEEEAQAVLGARVPVTINGKKTYVTKRQLLLEQIVNGAINKNPTMMRLALSLLKFSDGAPVLDILPEDEQALQALIQKFSPEEREKS